MARMESNPVGAIVKCSSCPQLFWDYSGEGMCPTCSEIEQMKRDDKWRYNGLGPDIDPVHAARELGVWDAEHRQLPHEMDRFEGHGGLKTYMTYIRGYAEAAVAA